jgi:hypothetical protein
MKEVVFLMEPLETKAVRALAGAALTLVMGATRMVAAEKATVEAIVDSISKMDVRPN